HRLNRLQGEERAMYHPFINEWPTPPEMGGGPTGALRVVIGGICWDYLLQVLALVRGEKNVMVGKRARVLGGGAANNAIVHRRLASAARIALLACLGDDLEGRALRQFMAGHGIALPVPPIDAADTSASYILSEPCGRGTIVTDPAARELPIPLPSIEEALSG